MELRDENGGIVDLVRYRISVAKQDIADGKLLLENNSLLSANNRYIMLCFMQSMQCMAWMEMDISDTRTLLQNLMKFMLLMEFFLGNSGELSIEQRICVIAVIMMIFRIWMKACQENCFERQRRLFYLLKTI